MFGKKQRGRSLSSLLGLGLYLGKGLLLFYKIDLPAQEMPGAMIQNTLLLHHPNI